MEDNKRNSRIKNSLDNLLGLVLAGAIIGGVTLAPKGNVEILKIYNDWPYESQQKNTQTSEWGDYHSESKYKFPKKIN